MKYIKTHKQLNEGLLKGKSLDRIKHEMEGKSDNDKIRVFIKFQSLHKLLPRNENGEIVYDGDLKCNNNKLTSLPDNLVVNGKLNCSSNFLTILPDNLVVNGHFSCSFNKLTSLPDNLVVNGDLRCGYNKLSILSDNLVVEGDLFCKSNNLTSLPDNLVVEGDLDCSKQKNEIKLEIPKSAKISGKIIL